MNDNFPKAGIKVKFLLSEFLQEAKKNIGDIGDDLTTGEVRVQFIIPLTTKNKSSYCQILKDQGHWAYTEEPDAFISHAHQHKFKDFLSALEWKFRGDRDASVWLDLFSINQHEPMDWTFDWLSTTFRLNVADIGRTVMVMSPWDNPYPYTRTWCIFEAFSTISEGGKFEIALSKTDEQKFLDDVQDDACDKMNAMVATIRAENSECSVESDRVSIYKIIRKTIGFARLDRTLFECYRKWVIDVAVSALDLCVENDKRVGLCCSIYQLHYQQGNYRQAEHYASQGLYASKYMRGEDHLDTVDMVNNLALALKSQGKFDEAVTLYKQCLETEKSTLGDDDPRTLTTMNNLALALKGQGQYDEAIKLCQQCLDRQKNVLGEDNPDTLRTMNNLANIQSQGKDYDKAIELYQRCLDTQKFSLGDDHRDTLLSMNNLGVALHQKAQYDEAIELYQPCLDRQKVILGEDHPDTFRTMNNLGLALYKQCQYDEAIELHRSCLDRQKVVFGEDHPDTLCTTNNLRLAIEKSKGP